MAKVPRLLQMLYNADFLDEEVLLEWAAKVSFVFFYDTRESWRTIVYWDKLIPFYIWSFVVVLIGVEEVR